MSPEGGLTKSGLTRAVSTTSHSSLEVISDGMLPQGPLDRSRARRHAARAIERSFSRRVVVRRSAENVNPMRNFVVESCRRDETNRGDGSQARTPLTTTPKLRICRCSDYEVCHWGLLEGEVVRGLGTTTTPILLPVAASSICARRARPTPPIVKHHRTAESLFDREQRTETGLTVALSGARRASRRATSGAILRRRSQG
jgi:hypothetical protein